VKENVVMLGSILQRVQSVVEYGLKPVGHALARWTKPLAPAPVVGTLADLSRSKRQLIAENLLLRQQLIILNRSVKRPRFTRADRLLFVGLASRLHGWKDALLIVKPETVLRWHRL
jgi:putative transposase